MQAYKFLISGKVQHVWYRKNVCDNARKQGFSGYVKNLADGRVEAGVYLKDDDFALFISILESGSLESEVENIEQFSSEERYVGEFIIKD
ncbi:acylphosphatase [Sulfurimonas sp. MAG313]|nr:acylphosphatase [Sulfurimonas sp. MAG313]MDF1882185.1 acylphosphatase [Sulfurimonas sp. MAG313]